MKAPDKRKPQRIIGIIPARYGSSRFPGKPLANISGKSLIQRTYENAQRCRSLQDLIVATDDERIFKKVLEFGGKVVMTSPTCPTGTERLAEAVKQNSDYDDVELIINIQGDEPLIDPTTLEQVIHALQESPEADMSTAVVKITSKEEAEDHSTVKCIINLKGEALYFSRTLIPNGHQGQWQPNVTYYKHLGSYAYRRHFLIHYAELAPTPLQIAENLEQLKVLEHGSIIKVAIVEDASIGVDTLADIQKVEGLL